MTALSLTPGERARKGVQLVLKYLQSPGKAGEVAASMGISDSTVSRIKTERMEEVIVFLAHLGLKVVDARSKCLDAAAYEFLTATHERLARTAPSLLWEEEERE